MEKKLLLVLEGILKMPWKEDIRAKVLAFMEPSTGIFKGIRLSNSNCDLTNMESIFQYLESVVIDQKPISLVAGICNADMVNYTTYLESGDIIFGNFQYKESENRFSGREKGESKKKHVMNRWTADLKMVSSLEIDMYYLCELVEQILSSKKDMHIWKAIQYSVENNTALWKMDEKIEEESEKGFPLRSLYLYTLHFLEQNDLNSAFSLIEQYLKFIHAEEYTEILCELIKIGYLEHDMTWNKMLEALQNIKQGKMLNRFYYENLSYQAFLNSKKELSDSYSQVASAIEHLELPSLTNFQLNILSETGILKFSKVSDEQKKHLNLLANQYSNIVALEIGNDMVFKLQQSTFSNASLSLQLGEEAYQLRRYSTCIPYYLDFLENQTGLDSEVCFKLGYAYFKINEFEKAITYLSVADSLGYHNQCAQLIEKLNNRMHSKTETTLLKVPSEPEPYLEDLAILISSGRSLEEIADLFRLTQEQIQMLKIIVAENHYMLGQYTVGDQYLNRVAPSTTEVKKFVKNAQVCRKGVC